VIEPTWGVDRSVLVVLLESYFEDKERIILKFPFKLAPYKAAVFPLLANKPKLVEKAREVYSKLKTQNSLTVAWDDRGNIGKRYYSQDEIGTILAVTIDFQTLEDETITLRNRDTTQQIRMPIKELPETIQKIIGGEEFLKFGKLVK
jgi:glycyl-tRNA synthetase